MPMSESQKGRAVEQLIGATLMLQSEGALRVSLPLVDDEGVDLVVGNRENDKSLLLQIKSRFGLTARNHYRANVRRATCWANPSRYLLFAYYDSDKASLGDFCWLVPASDFCRLCENQRSARPTYVFASSFTARADMWAPFRLATKDLAETVVNYLL